MQYRNWSLQTHHDGDEEFFSRLAAVLDTELRPGRNFHLSGSVPNSHGLPSGYVKIAIENGHL